MTLKDLHPWREGALIDGTWIAASPGQGTPVHDPADGAQIAEVPSLGAEETKRAIAAAQAALGGVARASGG